MNKGTTMYFYGNRIDYVSWLRLMMLKSRIVLFLLFLNREKTDLVPKSIPSL